jgi:hypothetical protein
MLTGIELGQALEAAIKLKGVSKAAVARHFGVKPPSIQDWIKYGRINKSHINGLVEYFADVVGPEHWGLPGDAGAARQELPKERTPPYTLTPEIVHGLVKQNELILKQLSEIVDRLDRVLVPAGLSVGDNFRSLPDAPLEAIETLKGLIDAGGEIGEEDRPQATPLRNEKHPKRPKNK